MDNALLLLLMQPRSVRRKLINAEKRARIIPKAAQLNSEQAGGFVGKSGRAGTRRRYITSYGVTVKYYKA